METPEAKTSHPFDAPAKFLLIAKTVFLYHMDFFGGKPGAVIARQTRSATMDVVAWLRGFGLGQYEAAFRDAAIDMDVLPELTDADLEKLGVPLGHRKRLLKAIAGLEVANGAPPPANSGASAIPPSEPSAWDGAERRNIAVLFCDLVGSTSISARLDAEEWRDLVNAYLDAAARAVTGMGGHVAKKLGDGLMALFGYPAAQENDSERAARAALAILRALAELNVANAGAGKPELAARIGIAAGTVVVDATGEVFGDAPNVAARVQALAEPGSVLITANVQRQLAGLFMAEDRGAHELKGVPKPVTLFRLGLQSGAGRRLCARALTSLVGREEETAAIARRWARAQRGEGQLLLVVGDPGIGKSRLVEEFRLSLGDTPHTWIEWSCSQLLQNTALHPLAEWGRQRFSAEEPAERRLADLEATLKLLDLDPDEHLPLLAPVVDIPFPAERMPQGLTPAEFRRRQLESIIAWVTAGARVQPLALICEDLHWADPTTLEMMRGLAHRGADAPLLIFATARPEFRPPWSMRPHHAALALAPLDNGEVKQMVADIAARHALSRETVDGVAARAGGVPLFVEEVTRLLLDRSGKAGAETIPPTLQHSLAARLDRLGPARETAQIAAVIGREFCYGLLHAVAGVDDAALGEGLERLVDADLLQMGGRPPNSHYRFKHALLRDAAYEGLLKSRRQALHARVAEALRDRFPAQAEAEPEMLAHHFMLAGLADPAVDAWRKAGEQAMRRSAIAEARAHFEKAIELADAQPDRPERRRERLRLQITYGYVLMSAFGHGASEASAAFARAVELRTGTADLGSEDLEARLAINYGLWLGHFVRGEFEPMRGTALAFLRDSEDRPDSCEAAAGYRTFGVTCWFAGEFARAQEHIERARLLDNPKSGGALASGQAPAVATLDYLASTHWQLGNVKRAVSYSDDAVERARASGCLNTIALALWQRLAFDMMRRVCDDHVVSNGEALCDIAVKYDLRQWRTFGAFVRGWTRCRLGDPADGIESMRRGIELCREQGIRNFSPLLSILLAEALIKADDAALALAAIDDAIAEIESTGCRWSEAEAHRVRGDILLKQRAPDAAETSFRRALEIAQAQQARSYELRAATRLARLARDQDSRLQGRDVLASVYGRFTEGFDTPDLMEAKALLDGLAS